MAQPDEFVLGYWKIRGLAAAQRMMFYYAGQKFTDRAYGEDAREKYFGGDKPELAKKNPCINLPYLIDGDLVVTQSNSILLHLGKKLGIDKDEFFIHNHQVRAPGLGRRALASISPVWRMAGGSAIPQSRGNYTPPSHQLHTPVPPTPHPRPTNSTPPSHQLHTPVPPTPHTHPTNSTHPSGMGGAGGLAAGVLYLWFWETSCSPHAARRLSPLDVLSVRLPLPTMLTLPPSRLTRPRY
eukprot:scaffold12734_cov101-Isochrysis_galbana.AAC.3